MKIATCYNHKRGICIIIYLHIDAVLELDVKNVLTVLREARFADADWAELGLQLIDRFESTTIKADHSQANLCMIETISQWLKSDPEASWKKLAEVLPKVQRYGEATAATVRKNTGILCKRMFCVRRSVSIFVKCYSIRISFTAIIFLTVGIAVTSDEKRGSSLSPSTSTDEGQGEHYNLQCSSIIRCIRKLHYRTLNFQFKPQADNSFEWRKSLVNVSLS